jgi:hypothetical protein
MLFAKFYHYVVAVISLGIIPERQKTPVSSILCVTQFHAGVAWSLWTAVLSFFLVRDGNWPCRTVIGPKLSPAASAGPFFSLATVSSESKSRATLDTDTRAI